MDNPANSIDKCIQEETPYYYYANNVALIEEDTFTVLPKIKPGCIDVIFADPPYFLSNNGTTCRGGKMVRVNKANWDEGRSSIQGKHEYNRAWISMCKKILAPNGSIWVSGTLHNVYSIGMALEEEGFKILNNITWQKSNPPPNLGCRCFTHSTETILWAKHNSKTAKHYFDYAGMKSENEGKQMKDVWTGSLTKASEKSEGTHPTQKPEYLLDRIIHSSSKIGDMVLDPFCGSGTTGVVAKRLGRCFIGIDNVADYLEIAKKRIEKVAYEQ